MPLGGHDDTARVAVRISPRLEQADHRVRVRLTAAARIGYPTDARLQDR